jgi:hypothetical protein
VATLSVKQTKLLAINPEIARVDKDGKLRTLPCQFPAELEIRLPVRYNKLLDQLGTYGS